jgi:hypothetical protein
VAYSHGKTGCGHIAAVMQTNSWGQGKKKKKKRKEKGK